MNNEARIKWMQTQLETQLQPTILSIHDDSHQHAGHAGAQQGAGYFTVEIASPLFAQKSLVECHKLIYQAVGSAIPEEIHALKIKILKPLS